MRRMQRGWLLALASWLAVTAAAQTPAPSANAPAAVQPDKAKAYYHYSVGHIYAERGLAFDRPELLSQAISEMELALQYDPDSTSISMELADLYASTGRWQSALQQLEDNMRRNPDDPGARKLLGRLYVRLLAQPRGAQLPDDLRQRAVRQFEEIVRRDPQDFPSHLILAQLYRANSQTADAEQTLKKALALQPDSRDAATQLALLYLDLGDYRSAIDLLQKVVAVDDDPDLLGTLAYAYEQTHDYAAATDAFSRALQRDPDNPAYRKGLGQSLFYNRQYDQAVEQYQSVLRSNPNDAESYVRLSQIYLQQRKYDAARDSLAKAEELAPDSLEVRYNQVALAEAEGKAGDAIALIQRVLEESAKPQPSYYTAQEKTNRAIFLEKLGALERERGNYSAAASAFDQVVQLGGDNAPRGTVRLIETYQQNHEYDRALQVSAAALQQYPGNRDVVIARASLLASTGDAPGAVGLLKPLLQNNAQDRELWLALAQIHVQAKEFDQAREAAARAGSYSESKDDEAYIYFLTGSIWERQKRFSEAEEQFRKALAINPDSAMTLNYLGYMFADQGVRLGEAVELIQKALEMDPNSGAYLDSLGWAYFRQNRLDLAEQYLQKAVERIPTDPTIRSHLGDVYYKVGRVSQAVTEWKSALEQWKRLPKNEIEPDEVASLERKLRDAGVR
jgi:tetratricopeptide (TPR) repeat protein